jgi:MFS family permease
VSLPAAVAILMNGFFQPFVGRLIDQFWPRLMIALGLCLLALSTAAAGPPPLLGISSAFMDCSSPSASAGLAVSPILLP